MEKRTAYNANVIFKHELLPEVKSDWFVYTNKRVKWCGFLGCDIKDYEVKEFAWFSKGELLFPEEAIATTHEEFVEKNPEYRVVIEEGGNPVAIRKAAVKTTFINDKYHIEYFETEQEAEDYFNHLTGMKEQVPFEFDAFLKRK